MFVPDNVLGDLTYPIPIAKYGDRTKDTYGYLIAENILNEEFVFLIYANHGDSGSQIVTLNWPAKGDHLAVGILTHGIVPPFGPLGGTLIFGISLHKKLELTNTKLVTGNTGFCGSLLNFLSGLNQL